MNNLAWVRLDRFVRYVHLYTGMFLVPWMLVYAASAFCLNHGQWVRETFAIEPPRWETEREVDFSPDDNFPQIPEEQAREILKHLELDGVHRIQGKPNARQMIIFRVCGTGNYRITWRRQQSRLVVERQQPFSFLRLVHFLHFRGGYHQMYVAAFVWSVVVDIVAVSIGIWVLSGIYLWARRPRGRRLGGVFLVGGILLFVSLTLLLCM